MGPGQREPVAGTEGPDGLLAEWEDDAELIQKNTSVVVRRVPGLKTKTLTATEGRLPGCGRQP